MDGSCCFNVFIFSSGEIGTVTEICDCVMDTGRSEIEVQWFKEGTNQIEYASRHDILELICTQRRALSEVYHDHLPSLGKGIMINMKSLYMYAELCS